MARRTDSHRGSDKPICYACNRPFDPKSPGATRTMGPTCAKRNSGSSSLQVSFETQLTFLEDGHFVAPPAASEERRVSRKSKIALPKSLAEKAEAAKIAFDELQREFSRPENIYYGEDAHSRFKELVARKVECHSFGDPSLPWLDPEFDIHLLIDHENRFAYYWRVFNATHTLIRIDPRSSREARQNIAIILGFSENLLAHREAEAAIQLSFACQITLPTLFETVDEL